VWGVGDRDYGTVIKAGTGSQVQEVRRVKLALVLFRLPLPTTHPPLPKNRKSANLDQQQEQEDIMAKGNNARKKETKKPKKDKK
jgi:hypothetical protein